MLIWIIDSYINIFTFNVTSTFCMIEKVSLQITINKRTFK